MMSIFLMESLFSSHMTTPSHTLAWSCHLFDAQYNKLEKKHSESADLCQPGLIVSKLTSTSSVCVCVYVCNKLIEMPLPARRASMFCKPSFNC